MVFRWFFDLRNLSQGPSIFDTFNALTLVKLIAIHCIERKLITGKKGKEKTRTAMRSNGPQKQVIL